MRNFIREVHCNLQILREYELYVKLKVTLFRLLTEPQPEHQAGTSEPEREGEPDACQAPIENETEQIACR